MKKEILTPHVKEILLKLAKDLDKREFLKQPETFQGYPVTLLNDTDLLNFATKHDPPLVVMSMHQFISVSNIISDCSSELANKVRLLDGIVFKPHKEKK
jgi:hypothetical protein